MNKKIIFSLIIISLFFTLYLWVDARAWWGWGGGWWGSGWSWDGPGWAITMVIMGLYYAIYEIRRRKMISKAKKDLEDALKEDSSWDINSLEEEVKKVFFTYQEAWTKKDMNIIAPHMTKKYLKKASRILKTQLTGKVNILENINLNKLTLMSVRDNPGRDGDMFAMEISASMIDYTIDETNHRFTWSTSSRRKNESQNSYESRAMNEAEAFKEYYIFIRHNGKWLLNNIKPKFSIIWDIIGLSESNLRKILKQEESNNELNDDMLYTD